MVSTQHIHRYKFFQYTFQYNHSAMGYETWFKKMQSEIAPNINHKCNNFCQKKLCKQNCLSYIFFPEAT